MSFDFDFDFDWIGDALEVVQSVFELTSDDGQKPVDTTPKGDNFPPGKFNPSSTSYGRRSAKRSHGFEKERP